MKKKGIVLLVTLLVLSAFLMGARVVINGIPYETFSNLLVTGDLITEIARIEVTTTSTLTANQVKRSIVTNYGMASAGDTTIPVIVGTTSFQVLCEAASKSWSLKPPSGEAFVVDGTALDADDEIDVGQTIGDTGMLVRVRTGASTYQWYFYSIYGVHADGGAS